MSINNASLKQKAQAFVATIANLSDAMKDRRPGGDYARDYNSLRALTAEINPQLIRVLPPEVKIVNPPNSGEWANATFVEIATYCQQIVNLLP